MKITIDAAVVQQALDALELRCGTNAEERLPTGAIAALRAAIEQAEGQEPVAWWLVSKTTEEKFVSPRPDAWNAINWHKHPLYTHPAPAQRERPAWVDVAIRSDIAKTVYEAVRKEMPIPLCPWNSFDADEAQRIVDSLKPFTQIQLAQPVSNQAIEKLDELPAQPVQEPVAWSNRFDKWWATNKIMTHKIKGAEGFAKKAFHAGIKSAVSSVGLEHPVSTGSVAGSNPARQATHPAPAPSQQNIKQELAECFDALAKCRDAFPAPLPNSTGDQEWKAAMADPLEVPEFVRVMVASNQAGPSWQELSREEAFALAHRRCTRYHHDALTPMYTFTGHHLMDFLRDIREKNAKGHV